MSALKNMIAAAIIVMPSSATFASDFDTKDNWIAKAGEVISVYEGSSYTQVSDDFDCQGLSLGIQQKPIMNGGLLDLINEAGKQTALKEARSKMPNYSDVFERIIEKSVLRDFAGARKEALNLQGVHPTKKCAGMPRGRNVNSAAKKEIQKWLSSIPIQAAQVRLKHKSANRAFEIAHCWKAEYSTSKSPLTFNEFLFHFDFITQAGFGGISDGAFYRSTRLVRSHASYNKTERERIQQQVKYLASWLRTNWPDASSSSYYVDAAQNADNLESAGDTISYDEVQLLFVRKIRAIVGNTPYQIVFLNRGVVDLLGFGRVNSTDYDFREIINSTKPINPKETVNIDC